MGSGEASRVVLEAGEGGVGEGEFPGLVPDEEVDLVGEHRGVRRGGGKEAAEGAIVAGADPVVEIVVLGAPRGGEQGFGALQAGEGAVPDSDRAGFTCIVMPHLIRHPPDLRCWERGEGGSRIKSGMTKEGSGARTA